MYLNCLFLIIMTSAFGKFRFVISLTLKIQNNKWVIKLRFSDMDIQQLLYYIVGGIQVRYTVSQKKNGATSRMTCVYFSSIFMSPRTNRHFWGNVLVIFRGVPTSSFLIISKWNLSTLNGAVVAITKKPLSLAEYYHSYYICWQVSTQSYPWN